MGAVMIIVFAAGAAMGSERAGMGAVDVPEVRQGVSPGEWSRTNTGLQVVFSGLLIMDWKQSLVIARSHGTGIGPMDGPMRVWDVYGRTEMNPLLGRHPSVGRVNAYMAAALLSHAAISAALNEPYRTIWQSVWIGIEAETVRNNYQAGIRVSW